MKLDVSFALLLTNGRTVYTRYNVVTLLSSENTRATYIAAIAGGANVITRPPDGQKKHNDSLCAHTMLGPDDYY